MQRASTSPACLGEGAGLFVALAGGGISDASRRPPGDLQDPPKASGSLPELGGIHDRIFDLSFLGSSRKGHEVGFELGPLFVDRFGISVGPHRHFYGF